MRNNVFHKGAKNDYGFEKALTNRSRYDIV